MKKYLFSCVAIAFFCFSINASAQTTHYVKTIATGDASGSSWNNSSGDLQLMINSSVPGDVVWVAGGTYKPIYRADNLNVLTPDDRNDAFVLKANVKIYGGFAGNETALNQRDSTRTINNTILSGDLGVIDDISDNAYHVVISAGSVGSAELNSFTIVNGNANGTNASITVSSESIDPLTGGGLEIAESSPLLTNITIIGNSASDTQGGGGGIDIENSSPTLSYVTVIGNSSGIGGGIYINSSSPVISNTIISGNIAGSSGSGGGIFNTSSSSPVLTNVIISGNTAGFGGGIENTASTAFLTNVTISGNLAIHVGGGILNSAASSPKIRNTIIYGNSTGIVNGGGSAPAITYSLVQGLTGGTGNIDGDTDPLFKSMPAFGTAPFTEGNYQLNIGSPAINNGNNTYFAPGQIPDLSSITTDLLGNKRFKGIIDLGAYEYNSFPLSVDLVDYSARVQGALVKLNWTTAIESNNAAFIISRSADGKNFTEIGKVVGAGISTTQKDYVYYDENPLSGINFYRLEQMDFDGHKTDLGIRTVNFASVVNNFIKVYPNPVKNLVRIEFTANIYHQLELTDVSGKVLQQLLLSSIDSEKKIDMSNLPSGVYFIKLTGNDKVESRKVVKE